MSPRFGAMILVIGLFAAPAGAAPQWPSGATLEMNVGRLTPTAAAAQRQAETGLVPVRLAWPALAGVRAWRLRIDDRVVFVAPTITRWSGALRPGTAVEVVAEGLDGSRSASMKAVVPAGLVSPSVAGIGGLGGGGARRVETRIERPPPARRARSAKVRVVPRSGAMAEPLLRPVIIDLTARLAACRPADGARAPTRVEMEVMIEPGGRARAWMVAPDKRNLTVDQWAAARPVGECLATHLGSARWPRPADRMPASFGVELSWQ